MQGREVDVVVLSCVRTGRGSLGFVSDYRRANVALSRAREARVPLLRYTLSRATLRLERGLACGLVWCGALSGGVH